jgi:hypothetical protein
MSSCAPLLKPPNKLSRTLIHTLAIPALRRQRQKDGKFEARLDSLARRYQKTKGSGRELQFFSSK